MEACTEICTPQNTSYMPTTSDTCNRKEVCFNSTSYHDSHFLLLLQRGSKDRPSLTSLQKNLPPLQTWILPIQHFDLPAAQVFSINNANYLTHSFCFSSHWRDLLWSGRCWHRWPISHDYDTKVEGSGLAVAGSTLKWWRVYQFCSDSYG
ncbi:hypothetical protein VTO42DRAFT_5552 [Malbranchea cinnamomea]